MPQTMSDTLDFQGILDGFKVISGQVRDALAADLGVDPPPAVYPLRPPAGPNQTPALYPWLDDSPAQLRGNDTMQDELFFTYSLAVKPTGVQFAQLGNYIPTFLRVVDLGLNRNGPLGGLPYFCLRTRLRMRVDNFTDAIKLPCAQVVVSIKALRDVSPSI